MSFPIIRSRLQGIARQPNSKTTAGSTIVDVCNAFKQVTWNVIDHLCNKDSYTMANWSLFQDRWIQNADYVNSQTYKRGSIVMADLGATNFKNEPSYEHPCVVLINRKTRILVVPCSSGAFGRGYPDVIDSPRNAQGFRKDTGVQVGQFRWIHKNRVLMSMGKVSSALLDQIDEYMLKLIPTSAKRESIIRMVLLDNKDKELKIKSLEDDCRELIEKNKRLAHQNQELQRMITDGLPGPLSDASNL